MPRPGFELGTLGIVSKHASTIPWRVACRQSKFLTTYNAVTTLSFLFLIYAGVRAWGWTFRALHADNFTLKHIIVDLGDQPVFSSCVYLHERTDV